MENLNSVINTGALKSLLEHLKTKIDASIAGCSVTPLFTQDGHNIKLTLTSADGTTKDTLIDSDLFKELTISVQDDADGDTTKKVLHIAYNNTALDDSTIDLSALVPVDSTLVWNSDSLGVNIIPAEKIKTGTKTDDTTGDEVDVMLPEKLDTEVNRLESLISSSKANIPNYSEIVYYNGQGGMTSSGDITVNGWSPDTKHQATSSDYIGLNPSNGTTSISMVTYTGLNAIFNTKNYNTNTLTKAYNDCYLRIPTLDKFVGGRNGVKQQLDIYYYNIDKNDMTRSVGLGYMSLVEDPFLFFPNMPSIFKSIKKVKLINNTYLRLPYLSFQPLLTWEQTSNTQYKLNVGDEEDPSYFKLGVTNELSLSIPTEEDPDTNKTLEIGINSISSSKIAVTKADGTTHTLEDKLNEIDTALASFSVEVMSSTSLTSILNKFN